jgi:hypothetical protein
MIISRALNPRIRPGVFLRNFLKALIAKVAMTVLACLAERGDLT